MSKLPSHYARRIQKARAEGSKTLTLNFGYFNDPFKIDEFPLEILELVDLESLDLSNNHILKIPDEISRLHNLVELNVSSNRLTELPEAMARLAKLRSLAASGNELKEIPGWLAGLPELRELNLGFNARSVVVPDWLLRLDLLNSLNLSYNTWLKDAAIDATGLTSLEKLSLYNVELLAVPVWIAGIPRLRNVELGANKIEEIPGWLMRMPRLEKLGLDNNLLGSLPEGLFEITGLKGLEIGGNPLDRFPEDIAKLEALEDLGLNKLQMDRLPDCLSRLTRLTNLSLYDNALTTLPDWLSRWGELRTLNLSSNSLGLIPRAVYDLKNLELLQMYNTKLRGISGGIGTLGELRRILLARNELSSLPSSCAALKKLEFLDLRSNRFEEIPEVVYELRALKELKLQNMDYNRENLNRIRTISPRILDLGKLEILDLADNPIETPPPDVVAQGVDAVRDFFRQSEAAGTDHLFEAKLLIVGEPGAGKTTLAHKIVDPNYRLKKGEKSTQGIDVARWEFPLEGGRTFRVNIWDFGGQEIYKATHQFFLTKKSLYALVADIRREDTDFFYWLNIVELLSDGSPMLIIKNEKQDRHREINERQLRGHFLNLKPTLATNLATNRGLDDVVAAIKHHIRGLPHVGSQLPRTWVRVRETLEQDPRNYITLDEYLAICQQHHFTALKDKLQLSEHLHQLGVCLHFQDDPLLKNRVILKPRWGTDAVYKVLDNRPVIRNLGRFTRGDLADIWAAPEYQDMRDELLRLMINFRLCYQIPGTDTYIAPQLLSEDQPAYDWDEANNLVLRYTYVFMPKGITSQFIVAIHPLIVGQTCLWRSGVVLEKDGARAEVVGGLRPARDPGTGRRCAEARTNDHCHLRARQNPRHLQAPRIRPPHSVQLRHLHGRPGTPLFPLRRAAPVPRRRPVINSVPAGLRHG